MHAIRPLTERSPHKFVAEQFREQIQLGWWPVGHKLPSERELASELNVSRQTIRQAIRLLADEGVVVPNGPRSTPAVAAPLRAHRDERARDLRRRAQEFKDLHFLRVLIESHTARLAAFNHQQEHLTLMIKAQGNMRTALAMERMDLFRAGDSDFHVAIAAASGNSALLNEVRQIRSTMFPVLYELHHQKLHSTLGEHENILEAIREKDADRASKLMTLHLQHTGDRLTQLLQASGAADGDSTTSD
jgi:GntR family transcriptional regulator, transcriptional repressor for pyruvate dehydrogenase complex